MVAPAIAIAVAPTTMRWTTRPATETSWCIVVRFLGREKTHKAAQYKQTGHAESKHAGRNIRNDPIGQARRAQEHEAQIPITR
jgi:hypothetical protein